MIVNDIERRTLVISLVTDDPTLQARLSETSSIGSELGQARVVHASSIEAASREGADMVVADCVDRSLDPFDLYTSVERARCSGAAGTAFVALIESRRAADAVGLAGELGFDLVLPRELPALIFANLISLNRYRQAISHGRRANFVRSKIVGERIGPWRLIPIEHAVECPGGSIQRLTDAEWTFLDYLVKRDLTRIEIPAKLTADIDANPRLNALVYKLKKKLGEEFPIVPREKGKYALVISEAL